MSKIVVYTKSDCIQCEYTARFLESRGIPFREVDIMSDPAMASHLRETGQLQMPYVVTDDDSWSGYRRDKLKGLIR